MTEHTIRVKGFFRKQESQGNPQFFIGFDPPADLPVKLSLVSGELMTEKRRSLKGWKGKIRHAAVDQTGWVSVGLQPDGRLEVCVVKGGAKKYYAVILDFWRRHRQPPGLFNYVDIEVSFVRDLGDIRMVVEVPR